MDRYNSITYPQSGFRILDNGHVWLSKIGEVRMFMHRPVTGEIKTLSIKHDMVGDWFMTIVTEHEKAKGKELLLSMPENAVGIDLGLESFMTMSDGTYIESPRFLRVSEKTEEGTEISFQEEEGIRKEEKGKEKSCKSAQEDTEAEG